MTTRVRDLTRRWVLPFVEPRQIASAALLPRFLLDMYRYKRSAPDQSVRLRDAYPCLRDRWSQTPFDPHYFYQGAWLARRIADAGPQLHVDIGSSVMMIGVLSAAVPTVFVDYRPLTAAIDDLFCVGGDLRRLPFADRSLHSLSCLHVIEHIGLGRYGDPMDATGSSTAALELARVLAPSGHLYLSVPVGRERVCFNAHRVFSPHTIISLFGALQLQSFALVGDTGKFRKDASLDDADELDYGCGMFEFVRSSAA